MSPKLYTEFREKVIPKLLQEWKPYNAMFTVMVILKIFGIADISWIIVISPVVVFWAPTIVLLIITFCIIGITECFFGD